jgi:hypothetical protein
MSTCVTRSSTSNAQASSTPATRTPSAYLCPPARSTVQEVVEAEQDLPQPEVGVGQLHELAARADADQQEVPAGGPVAQVDVGVPVVAVARKRLAWRRLAPRVRQGALGEPEVQQQAAAIAANFDPVEQRMQLASAAGLLDLRQRLDGLLVGHVQHLTPLEHPQ